MNTFTGMKGQIGETQYYTVQMTATELVKTSKVAEETDTWLLLGIQERFQRELSKPRIRDITRYFLHDPDRFSSSLIAVVRGSEWHEWQDLSDAFAPSSVERHNWQFRNHGTLSWSGGEMVILDGQHRMKAIEQALDRAYENPKSSVVNDLFTVMVIIQPDKEKNDSIRKIFNDVNKNAKPTPPRDNIITNMVDGAAIITRKLMNEGNIFSGHQLVNWRSNTIAPRSRQLTSLTGLYQLNKLILTSNKMFREQIIQRPKEKPDNWILDKAFDFCNDWWSKIFENLEPLGNIDEFNIPQLRNTPGEFQMIYHPQGQWVMVHGLLEAYGSNIGLTKEESIKRLKQINWSQENELWTDIFFTKKNTLLRQTTDKRLTAKVISCLILKEETPANMLIEVNRNVAKAKGVESWRVENHF